MKQIARATFIQGFAIYWSVFSCLYVFFITFAPIPDKNIRFADTILGFLLGTIVATIIQFFYGSSKSSKDKDDAIMDRLKAEVPAAPVPPTPPDITVSQPNDRRDLDPNS